MAKNSIFSSDKDYKSKYYFKPSHEFVPSKKSVWKSSDDMKGENAHKRIKALMDKMTTEEKRAFRDYYEGIQDDDEDGEYAEEELENLFAIGDKYFAGENIIEFISTLDDLPEGLA